MLLHTCWNVCKFYSLLDPIVLPNVKIIHLDLITMLMV